MRGALGTAAAAALLLGVSASLATTVETARGPVRVATVPERVAVYDIGALDTLDALCVPVAGVPERVYLPELRHLEERATPVGTLFEPDLEALNALAPDLVIVGGRSAPRLREAARVAPTLDMSLDGTRLLEETRRRILDYGALFERREAAATLLAALDARVAAARAVAAHAGTALLVMTNGPRISVFGPASRFGFIHRSLGLVPAGGAQAGGAHGEAVSFEYIVRADPDWLIVLDRAAAVGDGGAGALATLDNALVRSTRAWQTGRVVVLPAADLYIAAGGARAMGRVLDALIRGLSAPR